MSKQEYIVNTDDNARNRLTLQHKLYEEHSLATLRHADISSLAGGLEVGCGAGDMTLHLAKMLNNDGKLLSIDINDEQIQHAKYRVEQSGYVNVTFTKHCVTKLHEIDRQFDFIYCRMVLHHLASANNVINSMIKCLNANGTLIIEEPVIHDDSFCCPPANSIEQFIAWCRRCFEKNNRDFEVAKHLHEVLSSKGMCIKHYSLHHPVLMTKEQKMIYAMGLKDLTPQLLKHKIATQVEIDKLYEELREFSIQNHLLTWVRMHSVVATHS